MTLYDVRDNPVTSYIMRSLSVGAYHGDQQAIIPLPELQRALSSRKSRSRS
jgi:hypothetical protein